MTLVLSKSSYSTGLSKLPTPTHHNNLRVPRESHMVHQRIYHELVSSFFCPLSSLSLSFILLLFWQYPFFWRVLSALGTTATFHFHHYFPPGPVHQPLFRREEYLSLFCVLNWMRIVLPVPFRSWKTVELIILVVTCNFLPFLPLHGNEPEGRAKS